MKRIGIGLLTCCALLQAVADESQWLTDLSKAQAQAKKENKLVLMDFNGSDWCPPCKALRKNVLNSTEFVDYAKKNLVLVDVDFPRHTTQPADLKNANQALSKKFGITGFPTVIVLDGEGKELKKTVGYDGENAKDFIASLEKLKKKQT
jgi:thioredoxin-related protein